MAEEQQSITAVHHRRCSSDGIKLLKLQKVFLFLDTPDKRRGDGEALRELGTAGAGDAVEGEALGRRPREGAERDCRLRAAVAHQHRPDLAGRRRDSVRGPKCRPIPNAYVLFRKACMCALSLSGLLRVCEQAYIMAQNLDPNSDGRGVLQFKTDLMSMIKERYFVGRGLYERTTDYLRCSFRTAAVTKEHRTAAVELLQFCSFRTSEAPKELKCSADQQQSKMVTKTSSNQNRRYNKTMQLQQQDNYLEEAMKMRNLLEEFRANHGIRPPTILGVREHVFTRSVSSLAWFMSNQETSFVTLGQRVLANPLK
ncbi:hypothetical protein RHGRI_010982 [Rhododendron griersonianum]|uniref:Glycosyl transferase 48 domain-containing protein n=1 Tax=Rhododendron griersonianum TaxID=479676 RepID=A0AAV6KL92_9ERIC|nr:hypothetical protein RHGRI_010982 [Rhododendron griersonianum]